MGYLSHLSCAKLTPEPKIMFMITLPIGKTSARPCCGTRVIISSLYLVLGIGAIFSLYCLSGKVTDRPVKIPPIPADLDDIPESIRPQALSVLKWAQNSSTRFQALKDQLNQLKESGESTQSLKSVVDEHSAQEKEIFNQKSGELHTQGTKVINAPQTTKMEAEKLVSAIKKVSRAALALMSKSS